MSDVTSSSESHYELMAILEAIENLGEQVCGQLGSINQTIAGFSTAFSSSFSTSSILNVAISQLANAFSSSGSNGLLQEIARMREIYEEAHQISLELQTEAQTYLENQQQHAESFKESLQQIDPYPFNGLPVGVRPEALPNGGTRIRLPDGTVVDARRGQPLRVWDGELHTIEVPVGGSVTLPSGLTLELDPAYITEHITVEGLSGLPAGSAIEALGPGRYRVTLPNGIVLLVFREQEGQECGLHVLNPTGGSLVFGRRRGIVGFGLEVRVRLTGNGRVSFESMPDQRTGVLQFRHSGFLNSDTGTINILVAGGWDLIYRCGVASPTTAEPETFTCEEHACEL